MTNGATDRLRQLERAWTQHATTENLIGYIKALLRSGDTGDVGPLLRTVLERADDAAELYRDELLELTERIVAQIIASEDPEAIGQFLRQVLDDGVDGAVHDIVQRTPVDRLGDALSRADPSDLQWERILREAGIEAGDMPLTGTRGLIDIIVDVERATGAPDPVNRQRLAERIAELSPQQRGVIRGRLEQLQRRGWFDWRSGLGEFLEEALNSPYVARKMRFPGKPGSWIEVIQEGNKQSIVVRDNKGVRKRIPIDASFDPDSAIDDLLADVPPERLGEARRMMRRLVGGLVVAWIVYDTIETFRRIADPEFTRGKIGELVGIIVQGAGERIKDWAHSFFRLSGDPALAGIGWFMSSAIWPFVEAEIEQLGKRERVELARRILEFLRRAFPLETSGSQVHRRSPLPPLRRPVTRRGRDQRPAPLLSERPTSQRQPPPRPAKYPELSRADLDWWLRLERRQLDEDEAQLATERGRLRAWRFTRPEWIAEVEARIAGLRDAIRRARVRIGEYERAREDPHRPPGKTMSFPPLETVRRSKPLDIESQEAIEQDIERLHREIDDLIRVRAGLKPHEHNARELAHRWLRERTRERDDKWADLERLKRAQREEWSEHGSWLVKVMGDEDEVTQGAHISRSVTELPCGYRRVIQLELLGDEAELADAYRTGLDVGRLARRHRVRTDASLARQLELLSQPELEDLSRRVGALVDDLAEARVEQMGRAGFGALLDRIRESPPPVIPIEEDVEYEPRLEVGSPQEGDVQG